MWPKALFSVIGRTISRKLFEFRELDTFSLFSVFRVTFNLLSSDIPLRQARFSRGIRSTQSLFLSSSAIPSAHERRSAGGF
jgi:hypothetical protein